MSQSKMARLAQLISLLLSISAGSVISLIHHFVPPDAILQAGYPAGFRAFIPDFPGCQRFSFRAKLIGPVARDKVRTWSKEVLRPHEGFWTFEDMNSILTPGDVLRYTTLIVKDNVPYPRTNLTWIVPEPSDAANFFTPTSTKPPKSSNPMKMVDPEEVPSEEPAPPPDDKPMPTLPEIIATVMELAKNSSSPFPETTTKAATTAATTSTKPTTTVSTSTTEPKVTTDSTATTDPTETTDVTSTDVTSTDATSTDSTPSELTTSKPATTRPTTIGLTGTEPTTTKPTTTELTTTEPTTTKPTTTKPTATELTTTEPRTTKPTTKPTTTQPTATKPTINDPPTTTAKLSMKPPSKTPAPEKQLLSTPPAANPLAEDVEELTTPSLPFEKPMATEFPEPSPFFPFSPLFPRPRPPAPPAMPGFDICSNPWNFEEQPGESRTQRLERQVLKLQCELSLSQRSTTQLATSVENEMNDLKKLIYAMVSRMSRLENLIRSSPFG